MSETRDALQREWDVFCEDKPGNRNQWTQDQRWRADNPGEYQKLLAYRAGGARPVLTTEPGRRMVEHVEAWLSTAPTPPTGPTIHRLPSGLLAGGDRTNPANYRDRVTGAAFVVVDMPNGGSLKAATNGNDNTSYFVRGVNFARSAPSSGSRVYGLHIDCGRDVVVIGGQAKLTPTTASGDAADPVALQVDDGAPGGEVYVEGMICDSANAFGFRTKRSVIRQAMSLIARAYQDNTGSAHPDGVQGWDRGPSVLQYDDLITIETWMQAMASLLAPNPLRWERSRVYAVQKAAANAVYFDAGNTPDPVSGPWCMYPSTNSELWLTTAWYNASYRQKLDDVMCLKRILPDGKLEIWPYELTPGPGLPGTKYTSPLNPSGGSGGSTSPPSLGARQGDLITFDRVPHIDEKWSWGSPPSGVPVWNAGPNYQPLGYS